MASNLSRRKVEPALVEQRRALRLPVMISRATVRRLGEEAHPARLDDLSLYGARLFTDTGEAVGERLWLRFDGSRAVAATVVWSTAGAIGCRFDEALDRDILRSLTLALH